MTIIQPNGVTTYAKWFATVSCKEPSVELRDVPLERSICSNARMDRSMIMMSPYVFIQQVSKLMVDCLLMGLRGQGMDIYWRENFVCPTEEQYMEMVELKTGYMFSGSYQLMQLYSDNKKDYSKMISIIGRYFQIRDDYCNLSHQEGLEEWPEKEDIQAIRDQDFCDDITEGKFSFPVIHALSTPEGKSILNILKQRTRDIQLKKYCVSLMEKIGSLQYTRDVLAKLDREAREEVDILGGNPEMTAVLDELYSWKAN